MRHAGHVARELYSARIRRWMGKIWNWNIRNAEDGSQEGLKRRRYQKERDRVKASVGLNAIYTTAGEIILNAIYTTMDGVGFDEISIRVSLSLPAPEVV